MMRIKKDYVIKQIGKEQIIVPIKDEAIRFNGIITVNKTGTFLFGLLQSDDLSLDQLVEKMIDNYEIDDVTARKDILAFIKICQEHSLLDEE
jgi:hypothetical protein